MIHEKLLALAQAKIDTGDLPATGDVTTLGGSGSGAACAACERPIATDTAELEIEWSQGGRAAVARLHPPCYAAWSVAVERLQTD